MSNEIVLLRFVGLLFMLAGVYGKFAADAKEHQKKGEQHLLGVLEWIGISLTFVVSFWSNIHPFVTCFALLFIRIGTGNIIYNHVGNYKYSHAGSTDKLFDFWMQKLPNWLVMLIYFISTLAGVFLQFSNFNF